MIAVAKIPLILAFLTAAIQLSSAQATVHVDPASPQGSRVLQDQTRTAVLRDYLQSWQSLSAALSQNRPDLLDADFVGTAKDKLAETIKEQEALGIHTQYQDAAHDVKIVFYSPEGLSIQLTDDVQYDVQLFDQGKSLAKQRVNTRYVVVLTPAEVRWRVRVFQAVSQ
jgi:hypothetical protein